MCNIAIAPRQFLVLTLYSIMLHVGLRSSNKDIHLGISPGYIPPLVYTGYIPPLVYTTGMFPGQDFPVNMWTPQDRDESLPIAGSKRQVSLQAISRLPREHWAPKKRKQVLQNTEKGRWQKTNSPAWVLPRANPTWLHEAFTCPRKIFTNALPPKTSSSSLAGRIRWKRHWIAYEHKHLY